VLFGALFVVFFLVLFQGVTTLVLEESLATVCNAEGPFSAPFPPLVLEIGGLVILCFFFWQWIKEKDAWKAFFWLLLVSGGASNLIERLAFGCVKDFFTLLGSPFFNIADVVLSVSVVLLLWREFFPPVSRVS
jgi:lipoprotein signal peptidase